MLGKVWNSHDIFPREWGMKALTQFSNLMFMPSFLYAFDETPLTFNQIGLYVGQSSSPFLYYANRSIMVYDKVEEDSIVEILKAQESDEHLPSTADEAQAATNPEPSTSEVPLQIDRAQLGDYQYLLSHFYTVDSTTEIGPDKLNGSALMAENMQLNTLETGKEREPQVLIYHTHSQEAFADSTGDASTTIMGMGEYLSQILNETYGINTVHHQGIYDLIDGKMDRSKAYQLSEQGVSKILKEYPSIEVVIDLHRDGVPESKHLVTNINGKETAQIMFFNGLSHTKKNQDIAYLANPYIQQNLAFSLQLQVAAKERYPDLVRPIYLKGYRYNMHLCPKALLIEAGAQTNTVAEMHNAMEYTAEILDSVLKR